MWADTWPWSCWQDLQGQEARERSKKSDCALRGVDTELQDKNASPEGQGQERGEPPGAQEECERSWTEPEEAAWRPRPASASGLPSSQTFADVCKCYMKKILRGTESITVLPPEKPWIRGSGNMERLCPYFIKFCLLNFAYIKMTLSF